MTLCHVLVGVNRTVREIRTAQTHWLGQTPLLTEGEVLYVLRLEVADRDALARGDAEIDPYTRALIHRNKGST